MRLKRFLLRYYPPGIILEYTRRGVIKTKSIDLLDLSPYTDVEVLLNVIIRQEPLISVQTHYHTKYTRSTQTTRAKQAAIQYITQGTPQQEKRKPHLRNMIEKLMKKLESNVAHDAWSCYKILQARDGDTN